MRLLWLTGALRLHDHPAWAAAAADGLAAVLLPADARLPQRAAAWRARGLAEFLDRLAQAGVPVLDPERLDEARWAELARWAGTREVVVEAGQVRLAEAACARLQALGWDVLFMEDGLVPQPEVLLNAAGRLPRSFSAFHRRFQAQVAVARPLSPPKLTPPARPLPACLESARVGQPAHVPELPGAWTPGESAALDRLNALCASEWPEDPAHWDRADGGGSSVLSPWLARGELGPRQVWAALEEEAQDPRRAARARGWQRQLVWREYALALWRERPDLDWAPLAEGWASFPRRPDPARLAAWREGRCGIPVVDAALRQLREEGWIHNRLRMMAGTWLVKQMGQPWQEGLKVFEEWLVDWDPALNAMNWQWCAGCGVDAQPWFRLFSPERQAEKTDPEGRLLRRWVPELEGFPLPVARRAWALTPLERAATSYPPACPDPLQGRAEALAAWEEFRRTS